MPNQQEHVTDLLSPYLDGQVSADERARVEDHLATCGLCAGELRQMSKVVSLLRACPQVRPRRSYALNRSLVTAPAVWPRLARLAPVFTALAAVLLAALVFTDVRLMTVQWALQPQGPVVERTLLQPAEVPAPSTAEAEAAADSSLGETAEETVPSEARVIATPAAAAPQALSEGSGSSSSTAQPAAGATIAEPEATEAAGAAEMAADETPGEMQKSLATSEAAAAPAEVGEETEKALAPTPQEQAVRPTAPAAVEQPSAGLAEVRLVVGWPWALRLGEALAATALLASVGLWIWRRRLA